MILIFKRKMEVSIHDGEFLCLEAVSIERGWIAPGKPKG
jgi:hypothetical protein